MNAQLETPTQAAERKRLAAQAKRVARHHHDDAEHARGNIIPRLETRRRIKSLSMAYKRAVVAAAVEVADGQPGWAHTAKALADQYGRDYGKVCDDVWSATIAIQELPEGVELIAPPVRRPR